MDTCVYALLLILMSTAVPEARATTKDSDEHRLREFLLKDHSKDVRPVFQPSQAVKVTFGLTLGQLVKVDNKRQALTTIVWVVQFWNDAHLKWNASEFGGIDKIHLNPTNIWVPDTVLYNNADENSPMAGYLTKFQTKVIVSDKGVCIWMSPATFTSTCSINVKYWPFDKQICMLTFGSWSYGKNYLEFSAGKSNTINTRLSDDYLTNGDWTVEDVRSSSNSRLYSCCPVAFSDVTVTISVKRKPLYHVLHLVIPIALLSFLTLATFTIPVASGERISYVVTILLAMTVYLLLLADNLPETSEVVPLLEIFVITTLVTIFLSLLATIGVLVCFYKAGTPPGWLQKLCQKCCCRKSNATVKPQRKDKSMEMSPEGTCADIPSVLASGWSKTEEFSWEDVSNSLDRMFFIIFLIIPVTFFIALIATALNVS